MTSKELEDVTKQLEQTKVDAQNELSFKGRGLKLNTREDAKEIVEEIEKCGTMTALRFEGNTIGVEAAEAIAGALAKHPEFTRARWSDMFTGRMKVEIPPALKHLGAAIISSGAQLVELDLSDNAFGPLGVEGLVDLLKSKSCFTLQELRLNNNGLGTTGGKMLAKCLTDCYKSSCEAGRPLALKVFVSGRGRLENDGSIALSEVFKSMGSLEEVVMPQNGIHHPGITALCECFAHNPNLRILNLNDNTFTETGAKSMAKVLPTLQNLEVINFGDCLLKTEGAKILSKVLSEGHEKLRELILSGNEINKNGASAIAESMENKPNLQVLDLNSNQLGEEGIEMIQGIMDSMNKLDILGSLSDDEGSDEEEDEEDNFDENEEEEAQEDEDGEDIDDPLLTVRGRAISPPQQEVSAKGFLSFPSPIKLKQMGRGAADSIKAELGSDIKDLDKTMLTLIRISAIVTEDDEKTKKTICECADNILEEVFKNGNENPAALVANAFLVYIGILKGEDKKYRPPGDITGPLLVLEHAVRQTYFPKFAKEILQTFLSKPHPLLDKSSSARHKLLRTLYSF